MHGAKKAEGRDVATEVSPIKVFGLETCSWQEMQEAAVKRSLSPRGAIHLCPSEYELRKTRYA